MRGTSRRASGESGSELDLEAIAVNRVDDLGVAAARPSHVITVYGADHPGIVHAVSAALAERGVNITGLETRLAGADDSPLYVMIDRGGGAGGLRARPGGGAEARWRTRQRSR